MRRSTSFFVFAALAACGVAPDGAEGLPGDEAVAGFGINAGQISGIGIAVGVAVFNVEEINKIVAVVHSGGVELSLLKGLGLDGFGFVFLGEEVLALVVVADGKEALAFER